MIRGFDWASYQREIDGETASRAGYAFAIGKASEGTDYVNPTYRDNTKRLRDAGMSLGHYHYFSFGDGRAEADHFLNTADIQKGEYPALDLEPGYYSNGRPMPVPPDAYERAARFVEYVIQSIECPPLVYSNQSFIQEHGLDRLARFNCGLWLAAWQQADPTPVGEWSFVAFWQWRTGVAIPGVSGAPTQEDLFNGPVARLPLYGRL